MGGKEERRILKGKTQVKGRRTSYWKHSIKSFPNNICESQHKKNLEK